MKKFLFKLQFVLLFVIILTIFFAFEASKTEELVVITSTASVIDTLHDLETRGYIKDPISFWTTLLLKAKDGIEPGVYTLKKGMGAFTLSAALDNPDYRYVTIQEGIRREEVAKVFKNTLDWTDDQEKEFLKTFPLCEFTGGEGFLFPGRYLIHKDESPEIIKEEMHQKLLKALSVLLENPEENIVNISQIINIASLIQRESGGKKDMRVISGIIWNRLFAEMPLQIDATLQYVKGDPELWWPRVKSQDKYIESPYNTYKNKGLPPGPIANPGIAAIEAALDPVSTDCIFYLHDNGGNIHCSKTYDGHKRNISYYLP